MNIHWKHILKYLRTGNLGCIQQDNWASACALFSLWQVRGDWIRNVFRRDPEKRKTNPNSEKDKRHSWEFLVGVNTQDLMLCVQIGLYF